MDRKICLVGLGYVGLPLAIEFGKKTNVLGFDINEKKIAELKEGIDKMKEVDEDELKSADITFTSDPKIISEADFIIVAVPTPVDNHNVPDLTPVIKSSETVGKHLKKGSIVVYESTVYPGVTEEICIPILEKFSGLKFGEFTVGYSPERVNPGDKEHTIEKIVKVVSGSDEATAKIVESVYSKVITAGVHRAPNIKTAEAAKVIENTQRDLNIALMNELSVIFEKIGIKTMDVIEAAGTKWNFHKYNPGLVGGHCIGVDPYYLTFKAQELGYHPQVILAGRSINDSMAQRVGERIVKGLNILKKIPSESKVLILGLTFKENINDTRNSKVKDLIKHLSSNGVQVYAFDPMLSEKQMTQFRVIPFKPGDSVKFDAIVLATAHSKFDSLTLEKLKAFSTERPYLFDIRNYYDQKEAEKLGFRYECL